MRIQPLHNRLLIRKTEEKKQTDSGIIITSSKPTNSPLEGEVVAVGSGHRLDSGEVEPLTIKVGDIVLFDGVGHTPIDVDGEKLLMMKEDKIFGVIN